MWKLGRPYLSAGKEAQEARYATSSASIHNNYNIWYIYNCRPRRQVSAALKLRATLQFTGSESSHVASNDPEGRILPTFSPSALRYQLYHYQQCRVRWLFGRDESCYMFVILDWKLPKRGQLTPIPKRFIETWMSAFHTSPCHDVASHQFRLFTRLSRGVTVPTLFHSKSYRCLADLSQRSNDGCNLLSR